MDLAKVIDAETIAAPWGREVKVQEVEYDGQVPMLRLRIREGKRLTDLELAPDGARHLAAILTAWAQRHG